MAKKKKKRTKSRGHTEKARCGLCGRTGKLMKTECCGNWICDDYDQYVMFSFTRNSCARNHDRYTLCSYHYNEEHQGDWRECKECESGFETEMYVWYGTNEYNFAKLENPPAYKPTRCKKCNTVINLGEDGHMMSNEGYFCERCSGGIFKLR